MTTDWEKEYEAYESVRKSIIRRADMVRPEQQRFFMRGMPCAKAGILTGPTEVGKTELACSLATQYETGMIFGRSIADCPDSYWEAWYDEPGFHLGLMPKLLLEKPCKAMIISAEETYQEISSRQHKIANSLGLSTPQTDIISFAESRQDFESTCFTKNGEPSKFFLWLKEHLFYSGCLSYRPGDVVTDFVVFEMLPDFFEGDENSRGQGTRFWRLANELAITTGVTLIFLMHPSQYGEASGTGSSGTTAMFGGARFVWKMSRSKHKKMVHVDAHGNYMPAERLCTLSYDPELKTLIPAESEQDADASPIRLTPNRKLFIEALPPSGLTISHKDHIEATGLARNRYHECREWAIAEGYVSSAEEGLSRR